MITGPSGVGKGTLIRSLLAQVPNLVVSVSATTRPPRPGEVDGVDYHFLSDAEFDRRLAAGDFLEHAVYAGHRYGTLRSELDSKVAAGNPVVLEIDVQGARQVRDALPDAETIFVAPPSVDALKARLTGRGANSPRDVEARMRTARDEMDAQDEFAHVVVNDRLEPAVSELVRVVRGALDS